MGDVTPVNRMVMPGDLPSRGDSKDEIRQSIVDAAEPEDFLLGDLVKEGLAKNGGLDPYPHDPVLIRLIGSQKEMV